MVKLEGPNSLDASRRYSWNAKDRWDLPGTLKTKRNQRMTQTPFRFLCSTCHFWNHHWVSEYLHKKILLSNSIWKMEIKNTIFHFPLCILHSNKRKNWPVLTSSYPLYCLPNPKALGKLSQKRSRPSKHMGLTWLLKNFWSLKKLINFDNIYIVLIIKIKIYFNSMFWIFSFFLWFLCTCPTYKP